MSKTLNNREAVKEELIQILTETYIDKIVNNTYVDTDIDIYLYIDNEGNGTLDTFINPGSNSWKNDDHVTIHTIGRCLDIWEQVPSIDDICNVLEINQTELKNKVKATLDPDTAEFIEYSDIREYIENDNDLMNKLKSEIEYSIRHEWEIPEEAENILDRWENEQ